MSSVRLQSRIEIQSCLGKATLPGYDLYCDKRCEDDGSAKFTIAPRPQHQVPGVLYEISDSALDRLDHFEGPGYRRLHALVDNGRGPVDALTYIALDENREPGLRPYEWYLAFAVAGAIEHELPIQHIHRLQRWPCHADPDIERDTRHRELLENT